MDKFAEKLDKNNGTLSEKELDNHKKEIDKLLKIDNFNDYYKFMGLSVPSNEDLNDKLKKAYDNSEKKKDIMVLIKQGLFLLQKNKLKII